MKRQRILAAVLAAAIALVPAGAFAQPQDSVLIEPIVRADDAPAAASDIELEATYATLNIPGTELYSEAFDVVDIVNQERAALGRAPLTMDADLMEAAMQRAAETAVYFSHTRPDGTTCFTVSSKAFGENIAAGSTTAAATMDQWMNSDGHRENLLNSRWSTIGVGAFSVEGGPTYWVQLFGSGSAAGTTQPEDAYASHAVEIFTGQIDPQIALSVPNAGSSGTSLILDRSFRGQITLQGTNADEDGWNAPYEIEADSFQWQSSDDDVVAVDADGVLAARGAGTATVTGVSGGLQIDIFITVTAESPFTDVDESAWYAQAVDFAASNGLLTGFSDSVFGIGHPMTRAQLVTVMHRIAVPDQAGVSDENLTGMPDVEVGTWYTAAANWAVENGVVNGIEREDGSKVFGPDEPITREQFAVIVANYVAADLEATDREAFEALPDHGATSSWATDQMAWAVDAGLINGMEADDGTLWLNPGSPVTREQAATILMNAYNLKILP